MSYMAETNECLLYANITSAVDDGTGSWLTYSSISGEIPLVAECGGSQTGTPTKVPTISSGRRLQLLGESLSKVADGQLKYDHHRQLQSAGASTSSTYNCTGNPENITTIPLIFSTPNASSTEAVAGAVDTLAKNATLLPGFNQTNICSINSDVTIIYDTGSPTLVPTVAPSSRPSKALPPCNNLKIKSYAHNYIDNEKKEQKIKSMGHAFFSLVKVKSIYPGAAMLYTVKVTNTDKKKTQSYLEVSIDLPDDVTAQATYIFPKLSKKKASSSKQQQQQPIVSNGGQTLTWFINLQGKKTRQFTVLVKVNNSAPIGQSLNLASRVSERKNEYDTSAYCLSSSSTKVRRL